MEDILTLAMLVFLQAVLGFDNLLYISIESKRVPADKQSMVRKLGIGLAIALRIVLLFAVVKAIDLFQAPLAKIDWQPAIYGDFNVHSIIVLVGGLFIIYTAFKEITHMLAIHDVSFGMRPWSRTFTTAGRAFITAEDELLAKVDGSTTKGVPGWLLGAGRVARFFLVDAPVTSMLVIYNHEIFGHGYRAREAAANPRYDLAPPPPWSFVFGEGLGRNWTSWDGHDAMTPDRRILLGMGGLESQEVEQEQIALDVMRRGAMERGEGLMYLWCALDAMRRTFLSNTDMDRRPWS